MKADGGCKIESFVNDLFSLIQQRYCQLLLVGFYRRWSVCRNYSNCQFVSKFQCKG
jgi:hypothetical protein